MKKIVCLAASLVFAASFCYAQQPKTAGDKPTTTTTEKQAETKPIMTGKVKAINQAKSTITVIDEKSADKIFRISSTTIIYDAAFKEIVFDKIKINDKIKVRYTIDKDGTNDAGSIHIFK